MRYNPSGNCLHRTYDLNNIILHKKKIYNPEGYKLITFDEDNHPIAFITQDQDIFIRDTSFLEY